MPSWKKVIVSGSDAALNSLNVTNGATVSSSLNLTGSFNITGSIQTPNWIDFKTGSDQPQAEGRLGWDDGYGTLNLGLKGGNVNLAIGQEQVARVYNADSVPLTDGMLVYISGSQGNRIAVKRASATAEQGSANTLGMVTEPIAIGAEGFITTQGIVNGLNTVGLTAGALLYLSSSAGQYTMTRPTAPTHTVVIGYVERVHATIGSIYVKVDNGYEIGELHDVVDNTTTSSFGDLLVKSGSVWTNSKQLTGSYGLTGSLQATSFTGSLFGTSSWANNAVTASYVLNAVSSSFSSTASFVTTLNQNVLITGSATIGAASAGASENTLTLGARDNGSEGGQLGLNAPGGTYTSASMIDNYNNNFRILKGTNASSTGLVAQWNLHTTQMNLPAYTAASSFPGTATANLAVNSNGDVITVSTTGGSVFPYVGNAVITGSLTTTDIIISKANGAAYFRGGDDAEFWDINAANTVGIYGQQTQAEGGLKLGSSGATLYGSGSRFGIQTTSPVATLDVNGNLYVASGITGSLFGTASWATNVVNNGVTSIATAGTVSGITLTGGTITSTGTITLGGSISGLTNANLSGTAGITNANLANPSLMIGNSSIALGATGSSLTGLTSVTSTSFTGSLFGTASFAVSSSRAISSSFATLAASATNATNASTVSITGDSSGTAFTLPLILGTAGTGQTLYVDSTPAITYTPSTNLFYAANITATGSLFGTASYATVAQSVLGTVTNASTASNITPAINGNVDNRVLTADGDGTLTGEANLTFDGTLLKVNGQFEQGSGDVDATGTQSHAEGKTTQAKGPWSHAEGYLTITDTNADLSHAEGWGTYTKGLATHAEGYYTSASGDYSHAEGENTQAIGASSHAEGSNTVASGVYSHAEGSSTIAFGEGSHAEGDSTFAGGVYSHAAGYATSASGNFQSVIGAANQPSTNPFAFIIGNGPADLSSRSNLIYASGSRVEITGSLFVSRSDNPLKSAVHTTPGTKTEPAYTFIGDEDTGIFKYTTNAVALTGGGNIGVIVSDSELRLNPGTTAAQANILMADNDTIPLISKTPASSVTVGTATNATNATNTTNIAITNDTTTNATYYPVFVSTTSGNTAARVDSSTLTYNPSTNTLTVANLAGNASTATTASFAISSSRAVSSSFATLAASATSATSATSAGSVTNAVTFNNGGSGDASGTSFNGSAARTISYNTVGAPSTSGTNATGTWNISILGNAATATSATSATSATTATNANNVAVTDTTSGTGPYYLMFADGTTGNRAVRVDSSTLQFNATTNTLTVPIVNSSTAIQGGNGSASSPAFSFSGDTNTGMYNAAADQIGFAQGGSVMAIMSASGFHMNGSGTKTFEIGAGSAGDTNLVFTPNTTGGTGGNINVNHPSLPLIFKLNSTERARITSAGDLGLGTTSPSGRLHVTDANKTFDGYGNVNIFTSDAAAVDKGGSIAFGGVNATGGTSPYVFAKIQGIKEGSTSNYNGALILGTTSNSSAVTEKMRITSAGAMGLGVNPTNTAGRFEASNDIVAYSSSDKNWKKNIKNIDSPLEKISQINGVEFDWIEDEPLHGNKGHDVGVIAQEIELVIPEAVQTRESGMKAVQYDKIIPLLIESIKEQQKQIDELKELVNKLTK